jgi:hypothetical protein
MTRPTDVVRVTFSSIIIHLTGILIAILSFDDIAGAVSLGTRGDPATEVITHRHTIRETGLAGTGWLREC